MSILSVRPECKNYMLKSCWQHVNVSTNHEAGNQLHSERRYIMEEHLIDGLCKDELILVNQAHRLIDSIDGNEPLHSAYWQRDIRSMARACILYYEHIAKHRERINHSAQKAKEETPEPVEKA